jgi:hypothetical protein
MNTLISFVSNQKLFLSLPRLQIIDLFLRRLTHSGKASLKDTQAKYFASDQRFFSISEFKFNNVNDLSSNHGFVSGEC